MKNILVCFALAACGSSASSMGGDDDPGVDASIQNDSQITTDAAVDAAVDAFVCTADTQNDPSNCGACGRSCLGGSCSMGRCEATRLDSADISGIGDFTTDGLFMYYTGFTSGTGANHRLWKIVIGPATGATHLTAFAHPTPLTQISFDGTDFYTAEPVRIDTINRGTIKKTNKEPFSNSNLAEFQPPTTTAALLVGTKVYYATDIDGTNGGDIKSVPATGGSLSIVSAGTGFVSYMVADSSSIYWVDNNNSVRKCAIGGGPPSVVTSGRADFLDQDASNLYLFRKNTGEVVKVAKSNGTVTPLATGATAGAAVDDEHVYAAKSNQLIAVTKDGSSMSVIWERGPDGTPQCPTVMKIGRAKVIGDYIYFVIKPTTCNNVELNNMIYRLPRL